MINAKRIIKTRPPTGEGDPTGAFGPCRICQRRDAHYLAGVSKSPFLCHPEINPGEKRQILCCHVPQAVRQKRAPGTLGSFYFMHLHEPGRGDREGLPDLEAADTQRHAPIRAGVGIQPPDRPGLYKRIRLYLPVLYLQDLFFLRAAAIKHRWSYRECLTRGGRSPGYSSLQVRQGHRAHGCQHQRDKGFLGHCLDFSNAARAGARSCPESREARRRKAGFCADC